ncbi:MAG TPA: hypothetical protein DIC52_15305 [Candidatus Latescibacteria bacterium]|nr:hypothetical protein [Candidatus Latescibacterota bacterium]
MKISIVIVAVMVMLACCIALLNPSGSVYADRPPGDSGPYLNVRDFGATGDGESDDTDAIIAGIDAAYESGKTLYLPAGTYLITRPIRFTGHGLRVIGDGHLDHRGTTIRAGAEMPAMLYLRGSSIEVSRLYLDGNDKATLGLHAFHLNEVDSRLSFILVRRATSHGFFLDHSQISEVTNCIAQNNGGDGFYITDCNGARISQCRAQSNAGRGFTVTNTDLSGGCWLLELNSESNWMEGVLVARHRGTPVVLQRAWIEGNNPDHSPDNKLSNRFDAVRIVGNNVMATQCRISTRGDSPLRPKYVINLAAETVLELAGVSGEFKVGEKVVGAKSGAVGTVSFWQSSPAWGDDYPLPETYAKWLKRPKILTLREVSGTFDSGENVTAESSAASGKIRNALPVSATGCVIRDNWLARSSSGAAFPVDRVHEDPDCKNNIVESNRKISGGGSADAVHRE